MKNLKAVIFTIFICFFTVKVCRADGLKGLVAFGELNFFIVKIIVIISIINIMLLLRRKASYWILGSSSFFAVILSISFFPWIIKGWFYLGFNPIILFILLIQLIIIFTVLQRKGIFE